MQMQRCISSVIFVEDPESVEKRCILPLGHPVDRFTRHLWVEAIRSDGTRIIAEWDDFDHVSVIEYHPIIRR